jgi:hypothetical protein
LISDGVRRRPIKSDGTPIQTGREQARIMSRPQRFGVKLEFWSTEQQLAGLEMLVSDGLSDKATHLRMALAQYLRSCGITATPRPAQSVNGQQKEQAVHGV